MNIQDPQSQHSVVDPWKSLRLLILDMQGVHRAPHLITMKARGESPLRLETLGSEYSKCREVGANVLCLCGISPGVGIPYSLSEGDPSVSELG